MSTESTQPAQNNSQTKPEPPDFSSMSLEEELAERFRLDSEDQEDLDNEDVDTEVEDDGEGSDENEDDNNANVSEQEDGNEEGLSEDELQNGDEEGNGDHGNEVHQRDGSEVSGHDEGQSLQVSEEYQNTFNYLPADVRKHFEEASLAPETMDFVLGVIKRKDDEFNRKVQDNSDISKVIEPYSDVLARIGMTPAQKIAQYIAIEQGIMKNPLEGFTQLAQSLGVDLPKLFSEQQSQEGFQDPAAKEVAKLNQRFDSFEANEANKRQEALLEQIDNFARTKNDDGSLKYPHFGNIKPNMSAWLSENRGNLEDAYNAVVKQLGLSTPQPKLDTSQGKQDQRKPRKNIKKAKQLNSGVKSTSSAKGKKPVAQSMEKELEEGLKKINRAR